MSRIGTALSLNQVPAEYRNLPQLGRGFTSIIYKQDDKALVLTRDRIKVGWMQENMNGVVQSDFDTKGNRVPAYDEFPVYIVECDLMFPLDKKNRKELRSILADYDKVRVQAMRDISPRKNSGPEEILWKVRKIYGDREDPIAEKITPILSFMADWDCHEVDFVMTRNWMQTSSGELKCVDPAVDKELLDIARKRHGLRLNGGYVPKKASSPGMDY